MFDDRRFQLQICVWALDMYLKSKKLNFGVLVY